MTRISTLAPFIRKWEGGYVNNPADKGGATNMGVTLNTWKEVGYDITGNGIVDEKDIKALSTKDFEVVLKHFWDKCKADNIVSDAVAFFVVDWFWGSGYYAIKNLQIICGVASDGVIGKDTLGAVNSKDEAVLLGELYERRHNFIEAISKGNQAQFKAGWHNRNNDLYEFCKNHLKE